jgi:hypothetical protein
MAGLVPAMHVFCLKRSKDVDARHKAGHDEVNIATRDCYLSHHSAGLASGVALPAAAALACAFFSTSRTDQIEPS